MTASSVPIPSHVALPNDERWWVEASCAELNKTELKRYGFHGRTLDVTRRAREQVCDACPIRPTCLAVALVRDEPHDVWGGTTAAQRKQIGPQVHGAARRARMGCPCNWCERTRRYDREHSLRP